MVKVKYMDESQLRPMITSSRNYGKLLAVGCSYTFGVECDNHETWPSILAEKLNMDCVNLGQSGVGNEYIYSKTLDAITTEDYDLVVIMWTEFQRSDWLKYNDKRKREQWVPLHFPMDGIMRNSLDWKNDVMNILFQNGLDDTKYQIDRFMRFVYSIQEIANMKNIKLFQTMGTWPCAWDRTDDYSSLLIDSIYFDKIQKFIGWPIFPALSGFNSDTLLDGKEEKWWDWREPEPDHIARRILYRIGPDDTHPNPLGYKIIAEKLYKEIINDK